MQDAINEHCTEVAFQALMIRTVEVAQRSGRTSTGCCLAAAILLSIISLTEIYSSTMNLRLGELFPAAVGVGCASALFVSSLLPQSITTLFPNTFRGSILLAVGGSGLHAGVRQNRIRVQRAGLQLGRSRFSRRK